MAKNITEIPYRELVERTQVLARTAENTFRKIRGVVQDVYSREVTTKFDWDFLWATSSIITESEYKTGTCAINTGDTSVDFTSATITASMTGRKIKIDGNDVVYDFTYVDTNTGTLLPSFEGAANATGNGYTIFQPYYALAGDFDRFPKDGGLYKWEGGRKNRLPEEPYRDYTDDFLSTPGTPERCRLAHANTIGQQLVEFIKPPADKRVYGYDYIRQLKPMHETTMGTIDIAAQDTVVYGIGTRFTEATTGDWLRVDAFGTAQDSSWYRIIRINNDTQLTLATAFANSAVTSANYSICNAPEMPPKLHNAILMGALRAIALDQNDEAAGAYHMKLAEVMSDSKRLYVTRTYSQRFHMVASDQYMYRR